MSIEAISGISSSEVITPASGVFDKGQAGGAGFADHMNSYLNDVNQLINKADLNLRELAVGKSSNIHEVLMSIQKAKTALELGLQVRNRLLEGYQEIMRMQI